MRISLDQSIHLPQLPRLRPPASSIGACSDAPVVFSVEVPK